MIVVVSSWQIMPWTKLTLFTGTSGERYPMNFNVCVYFSAKLKNPGQ